MTFISAVLVLLCFSLLPCKKAEAAGAVSLFSEENNFWDQIYPGKAENCFYYVTQEEDFASYTFTVKKYSLSDHSIQSVYTITDVKNGMDFYYLDDVLYYIFFEPNSVGDESDCTIYQIDLIQGVQSELATIHLEAGTGSGIAVDHAGRIYLSTYYSDQLFVFDGNGNELACAVLETDASRIIGIDEENRNIYFTGDETHGKWGYPYTAAVKVARWNTDGTITLSEDDYSLTELCDYSSYHYGSVELLNGRYLADLSTNSSDTLYLLDSRQIDPADVTAESTDITRLDDGAVVPGVRLANEQALLFAVSSRASEYRYGDDISSVGSRAAFLYRENKNLLFVLGIGNTINCFDLDAGRFLGTLTGRYAPYKIMSVGGKLVLLEKADTQWAVECFDIAFPTAMSLQGAKKLTVGETAVCQPVFNTDLQMRVRFESSDPSILSVDEDGRLSAWTAGTVILRVKTDDGSLQSSMTVRVADQLIRKTIPTETVLRGSSAEDNISKNAYSTYAIRLTSYLNEPGDGQLMLCYFGYWSNALTAEYYAFNGKKVGSDVTVTGELDEIIGFFAGEDALYIVCAQDNDQENDELEVLRIVRYDSEWNRLGACSISGINTTGSATAGSLRMTEEAGTLYVYTCHTMYKSGDGKNHQANMIFAINEADMVLTDSYTGIMNISYGYVSHSFNQFIEVHDGYLYRADHGDAYPRGLSVVRSPLDSRVTEVDKYAVVTTFAGNLGANYTGASLGGFALSSTHAIIAYNEAVSADDYTRNIKTGVWDPERMTTAVYEVTSYTEEDDITCFTPQLVKLNENQFLLMWEEASANGTETAMVYIDNSGKPVGRIFRAAYHLSDCQPILLSDGTLAWYVSDGTTCTLYDIDPYRIDPVLWRNGWVKANGLWYYFRENVMQTGWQKVGGKWYYLNASGAMQTGWQKVGGKWYYLDASGVMQTGWQKINSKWYLFSKGGVMLTGWQQVGDKWYYLDSSGAMQTGWIQLNGKWYYLDASGVMQRGWLEIGGKYYYLNPVGGAMVTDWKQIGDIWYFFKDSGVMAAKEWYNGYWFNASGSWTYPYKASWKKDSKGYWFGDDSGWYAKSCTLKINDKLYTFDAKGYWVP